MSYLHFEPCNFSAAMFDTNDLSAIRGGSRLIEEMPKRLGADLVQSNAGEVVSDGGSKLLLRLAGEKDFDREICAFLDREPWRHFTAIWGYGDSPAAARQAAAKKRAQVWSIAPIPHPKPGTGDRGACVYDRMRPATEREVAKGGKGEVWVSAAVHARRSRGDGVSDFQGGRSTHDGRAQLFGEAELLAPQSFDEICYLAPDIAARIPLVVRDKIAVLRLDAIGAGKKLDALKNEKAATLSAAEADAEAERAMTQEKEAFYTSVGNKLVTWLDQTGLIETVDGKRVARVDVHFWGGEDIRLFAPAYRALWIAEKLLELIDEEPFVGGHFPHRLGLAIANKKVPIRQLCAVADDLEDAARGAPQGKSAISFAAFESASPPMGRLDGYWKGLYGDGHTSAMETYTREEFQIFLTLACQIGRNDDDSSKLNLSISQVNRILRELGAPRRALLPDTLPKDTEPSDSRATALLESHWKRVLNEEKNAEKTFVGTGERPFALLLAHFAQLHPYARAVATDLSEGETAA